MSKTVKYILFYIGAFIFMSLLNSYLGMDEERTFQENLINPTKVGIRIVIAFLLTTMVGSRIINFKNEN